MNQDTIRYGIIGTGMMGVEHIENLLAIEGAEITALSDPAGSSIELSKAALGTEDVAVFNDHRELLAADLCDAVVIASPNMTHVDILLDAIKTPLHILVEKPLCTTVADCDRVIAAAEGREALLWVGLEYRYMPPVRRLIEEVGKGAIGDVQMVSIREHRFPFLEKVDNWNRFAANTGGTLVEKCCHFFDLMNLVTGAKPISVFASGAQNVNHLDEVYNGKPSDMLDNAYVIVEYDNGARGMLDLCMFAEATKNQEELVAVGNTGKLEALLPESVLRFGRRGEHSIGQVDEETVHDPRVRHEGLHHGSSYLEHLDFMEAIRSGSPAKVSLADGRLSVAIGEAAHRSIAEHRPVQLSELG